MKISLNYFSVVLICSLLIAQLSIAKEPSKVSKPVRQEHTFLFLSDIHYDAQAKTTNYNGGDTGEDLWAMFLKKVDQLLSAPDAPSFIVYTGDLPGHYSCTGTCYLAPNSPLRANHDTDLIKVIGALNQIANKHHKPLFYLPGNNDALSGDYYSFADSAHQTPLDFVFAHQPVSQYFYPSGKTIGSAIPGLLSNPAPKMGYYSACPEKGLRLIAMNTVMNVPNYVAVDGTKAIPDALKQIAWLGQQLAEARQKHEKVYIAMHVPPGNNAWGGTPMWAFGKSNDTTLLNTFLRLTTKYKKEISGILYGHTHMEELRRLHSADSTITAVAISCPGITPQHGNNPGFKIVNYNAANKELTDFTTYYTTPGSTQWGNLSYTFSKAYGAPKGTNILQQISKMSLNAIADSMNNIYNVMNGQPGTGSILAGIEVYKK